MKPVVLKEVKYYFDKVRNEIVFDECFLSLSYSPSNSNISIQEVINLLIKKEIIINHAN